jgi:hypothetical protein
MSLLRQFARTSIVVMPSVLLPLGEALTLLPAGPKYGTHTAGPGFGISRHVPLLPDPEVAFILVRERLGELGLTFQKLAGMEVAPAQLRSAQKSLKLWGIALGLISHSNKTWIQVKSFPLWIIQMMSLINSVDASEKLR